MGRTSTKYELLLVIYVTTEICLRQVFQHRPNVGLQSTHVIKRALFPAVCIGSDIC